MFAQHIEANRHELGKGLDEMAEYKASEVMGHDAAPLLKRLNSKWLIDG